MQVSIGKISKDARIQAGREINNGPDGTTGVECDSKRDKGKKNKKK